MVIEIMMWFCCGHHVQDGLKPAWPSTGLVLYRPGLSEVALTADVPIQTGMTCTCIYT